MSTAQPLKVATPATAARVLPPVQVRIAPFALVRASVTVLVSVVTVAPADVWIATTGCWANAVWLVAAALGCVVKARREATAGATVTEALDAPFAVHER